MFVLFCSQRSEAGCQQDDFPVHKADDGLLHEGWQCVLSECLCVFSPGHTSTSLPFQSCPQHFRQFFATHGGSPQNTLTHEPCRPLCHFVTSPHTVGSHLRTQIVFFRQVFHQNLRQERSVFFAGALCPALLSASLIFPHIVGNHPVLCIKNSPCEGIGFCQNLSGFCPFSRRSRN